MILIEKYLSKDTLNLIGQMIGESIDIIYSKALYVNIDDHTIRSNSYALRLTRGYLCIETKWYESDEYEYYKLQITRCDTPKGVERSVLGALVNPSEIQLTSPSIINSITLYTETEVETWNAEGKELITVKYDSALLFSQRNGKSFLVGTDRSIADTTIFIRGERIIEQHLKNLVLRYEWK